MASVILKSINKNSGTTPVSPLKSFEVELELPATLGRGPILKCPEKKISRNHVMIDWDDEGVLVTSTHIRPTFIVKNGEEKTLSNGQSAVLNNEDSFGLLEENFWYKVIIASSCKDEPVTESKIIQMESSPCLTSGELPTDQNEIKPVEPDSNELPTDENENKPIKTDNTKVHLTLDKDPNKKEVHNEPVIGINTTTTDSNKIEDSIEETDEKVEIDSNPSEDIYNHNDRKRTLPNWMRGPSGKQEPKDKNSSEKVKNPNENKVKKRNASRPSKKGTSLSKFYECSDDDIEDKISPRKETTRVNQKQIKERKSKNDYHSVSQDFDSPDLETESGISESTSDNKIKPNINTSGGGSDGKMSPKKVTKRVNQKQIKQTKGKNQYHKISQDIDDPDFETENSISEATPKKKTKDSTKVSNLEEKVKSDKKEHNLSDDGGGGDSSRDDEPSMTSSTPAKVNVSKEVEKNSQRKSCQFGEDCYRKNPQHRKELAHPGDSDYVSHESASDDDDDDRPECEYGLNCYRKNPQHKKDFKHTKKPQPPRNAKKKGKRKNEDSDDSENEYDFDDSFLNDDTSDDYAPTDSDGPDSEIEDAVEEEDTKRMVKEAKKFVKRRKH